LWHLLLAKKLSLQATKEDFIQLTNEYPCVLSRDQASLKDLQEFHSALSSIIILDEEIDDRATLLLKEYKGHLVQVSRNMTLELLEQSPDDYMALVADFNDNLAYSMQATRGIPALTSSTTANMPRQEWIREIAQLETTLQETLQSPTVQLQASFIKTLHQTIPQPAHVDYPWQTLAGLAADDLFLAFFPLTSQGMILQLWPNDVATKGACHTHTPVPGQLVFVPLDKMLIVPSHTIHGGGFKTISCPNRQRQCQLQQGNVRFHLYIATQGTPLPVCAQNVYTMPQDRRLELSQICLNAPGLDDDKALLMQLLFE
jgi:hypothetical protein